MSRAVTVRRARTGVSPASAAGAGPVTGGRRTRRRPAQAGRAVAFVLATAWLIVVIAPIYYMMLASFRSQGTYLTANPWLPAAKTVPYWAGTCSTAWSSRPAASS
jgi:ABC-type glycerol-3-phosphate transport system permease component